MDNASDVSPQSVDRMLHILGTESKELARFLVDEEITPPDLIHPLVTANLITPAHVQSILTLDHTTHDKYMCLLNYVKTVIATSISNGFSNDTALIVKNFINTLQDNNLHRIAFRLHPELAASNGGSEIMDNGSASVPGDSPHFYNNYELPNEPLEPTSRSTPTSPASASAAAGQYCSEGNTSYFTASSGYSASPHMRQSESYPTFGNGQCGNPCRGAAMHGVQENASDGNIPNSQAEMGMKIVVEYNKEVFGPLDDEASDDEKYRNSSNPRGLVFIANYSSFKNDCHTHREGSDVDVRNLHSLFKQMGYVVPDIHRDLTKAKTLNALRKFRDDERHKLAHSCVVIIMSHGHDDNNFYTSDGLSLSTVDVLEMFSNRECQALIDKPKLFILQYCRGDRKDMGVPPLSNVSRALGEIMQTDSAGLGKTRVLSNKPTFSDMLLVYSTVEGYVSYRHPQHGSWLIKALCQVFMKHACINNLDQLLKKVSKLVSDRESEDGRKQSCEIRLISFNKDFYFNPTATFDETRAPFISLDDLASALPHASLNRSRVFNPSLSGYSTSPQLTPRGYDSPHTASRWSLNSPCPSDSETHDVFHNSSGNNSSVENLSSGHLPHRRTSIGNGNNNGSPAFRLRQSASQGHVGLVTPTPSTPQHLSPFLRTGARPRVSSGGSRRNSPSASPRPLSGGDPVQLHPRLFSGSSAKRISDPHESAFNFFQPSMVESNGNDFHDQEYSAGHLGNGDSNTQLNRTCDNVDSRVGSQPCAVEWNRSAPTAHNNLISAAIGIPENATSEACHSSPEGRDPPPREEETNLNFGSNFSGEDVVTCKKRSSMSSQKPSQEKSPNGAREHKSMSAMGLPGRDMAGASSAMGLPSEQAAAAPGASSRLPPVAAELSYQQYRRERSMELTGRSGSEFPECSIKRQLSVESERDVIASIRRVRTYMQVKEAEHMIPQVDSLTAFVKEQEKAHKKRKKESQSKSQSQE